MNYKILIIYMMIIIFFNALVGMFAFQDEKVTNLYSSDSMLKSINIRNQIVDAMNPETSWFAKLMGGVVSVVAIPFIIIESILWVLFLVSYSVTILPNIINLLVFTPLGLMVVFGYVIPAIRGN